MRSGMRLTGNNSVAPGKKERYVTISYRFILVFQIVCHDFLTGAKRLKRFMRIPGFTWGFVERKTGRFVRWLRVDLGHVAALVRSRRIGYQTNWLNKPNNNPDAKR